jgi:hypothetical protein
MSNFQDTYEAISNIPRKKKKAVICEEISMHIDRLSQNYQYFSHSQIYLLNKVECL